MLSLILAGVVAIAPAANAPLPSASPSVPPLRGIATVKSTPYCTSFATHFNGAVVPMVQNDYQLTRIDTGLESIKVLFSRPDFATRFATLRAQLVKQVGTMQQNLPTIQAQVNQLRLGERLTSNPAQAKQMRQLAEQMQAAYDKQHQMTGDLLGVVQGMMDFDTSAPAPIGGSSLSTEMAPEQMTNIKSYLKFDGMRDRLTDAETKAGDIALDIADNVCR
ncbi:MAG: hypothetical protein M3Y21_00215 [Candidatus Eremiobacteraeota bacterium]|nr:hypothetical protein [Candidatus Eremiobacteraeota bacterium]